MRFRTSSLAQTVMILLAVALYWSPSVAQAQNNSRGFVYVATNQPSGNMVLQFSRNGGGLLTKVSEVATGGEGGTGNGAGALDPLGSQDSVLLNGTGTLLLAVNAGSNQVSSLAAGAGGLRLLSTVSSRGTFPNSVALHGDLVYVLNARGTPNISGFRVTPAGTLRHIPGSTRNLPGGSAAAPHDIRFTEDGTRVVVTEGGTNQFDIFELGNNGVASSVSTQASEGAGVFGLRFGREGVLLGTEANSGSASSYELSTEDSLTVISGAVADTQKATCWISVTGNGQVALVSNTGSGTLSSYRIARDGTLTLVSVVAGSAGTGNPIDSAFTDNSEFLYVVDSGLGRVLEFRAHGTGLTQIGTVTGLPTTVQGIAAQ